MASTPPVATDNGGPSTMAKIVEAIRGVFHLGAWIWKLGSTKLPTSLSPDSDKSGLGLSYENSSVACVRRGSRSW